MTRSLEQLVLSDEIIGMVRRMMFGVEVNKEILAVDVINEVSPGGQFLGTEHTFRLFKDRIRYPTLLDSQPYAKWEKSGKKTMGERIREKLKIF